MRERSNTEKDARIERQVVFLVLHAYPELLSEGELEREIARNPDDFGERDAIARSVFSLVTLGLVHCCGPLVIPSRAALRLHGMEQEHSPGEAA